jgi:hypothetical protein
MTRATTLLVVAMTDPKKKKKKQHPSLLEMDNLLYGVRLDIARPPAIRSALLLPNNSVLGFGVHIRFAYEQSLKSCMLVILCSYRPRPV